MSHVSQFRQFFAWPGKRNYEGVWWSSTNRGHVEFESLLEREYLLAADAAVDVVAVAAQPLALLWPHGTTGQRNHVPDFFVRLASGDGRLVDVRAANRVAKNAAQFAMTRQAVLIARNTAQTATARGLAISGSAGRGKSTAALVIGRRHERMMRTKLGRDDDGFAPVVYSVVPPGTPPKMMMWRASRFPDCGPNKVHSGKDEGNWRRNTRNSHPNFVRK